MADQVVNPWMSIPEADYVGLQLRERLTEPLPSGKAFEVLRFVKVVGVS